MKVGRKSILWIIVVICLGILAGCLTVYTGRAKKVDAYDMELVEGNRNDEMESNNDNVDKIVSDTSATSQDNTIGDQLDKGVTTGGAYSEKLVAEGSKNILILGEDNGNKLYDTIGIISIDRESKKVSIIMLPRDIYVDYSQPVLDVLQAAGKSNVAGMYKLNVAHHIGAMVGYEGKFSANSISFLAQVIKEKFEIDVDDYIKINTKGFNQVVDLFGGVVVNVPYDMNYDDPAQNLSIHLAKGKQRLNGKQAEGFVRFRHGYKDDGTRFDVDRKKNQLVFLNAFIEQHGTISKINKIPGLLKTLDRNIMHSIGLDDILLSYMGLAKDIINDKYVIEDKNINGEDKIINGEYYIVIR